MKRNINLAFLLLPTLACALLSALGTRAANANQWKSTPIDGDWNNAANWSAGLVPNSSSAIATFGSSSITAVSLSADTSANLGTEVNGITFNAGASAFTITATTTFGLTISGVGIANSSGVMQNFVANDDGGSSVSISFTNNASAGNLTHFTANGATNAVGGGSIAFNDTSTAGNATFVTNAGVGTGSGGSVDFYGTSTAGTGSVTNNGESATNNGFAASATFHDSATAGNGVFTNNGGSASGSFGGVTEFMNTSTAGNATLIAGDGSNGGRGGRIDFREDSAGGTARVELSGDGSLEIDLHSALGVTVGSIEGSYGFIRLGRNNLTVGSNNLTTTFSGLITDGGRGRGGSLTKIGTGTLTLNNTFASDDYSGGTLINAGTLIAGADHVLGTGNVSLTATSVTLTLQGGAMNDYIADNVNLSIVSGSTVNLNFTGTPDTIGLLILDGVSQLPGLYGSAASGAPNQRPQFSGLGEVLVTAIPEPSPWAMMLGGAGTLLALQHFRRRGWNRIKK